MYIQRERVVLEVQDGERENVPKPFFRGCHDDGSEINWENETKKISGERDAVYILYCPR